MSASTDKSLETLKVAVIGGTGGLGRAISKLLASKGAKVTVLGRTFRDEGVENINFIEIDLTLIKDVNALIDTNKFDAFKYHIIVFTNGIFAAPKREETSEGLEKDTAVSYLSRLELLKGIIPSLGCAALPNFPGIKFPRIFIMGYPGSGELGSIHDINQDRSYAPIKAHMTTVAGNEAIVTHFSGSSIYHIYGLNPGLIRTNIRDNYLGQNSWKSKIVETLIGWFNQTPEDYAEIIAPLLTSKEIEHMDGAFFNNKGKEIPGSKNFDKAYADRFIEASNQLLESKGLS